MQRKNWLTFVLACGLCQAGTALAQQQPDFSKVELKITKVTDNIYMLSTPVAGNACACSGGGIRPTFQPTMVSG